MIDNGRVLATRNRGREVAHHLNHLAPYVGAFDRVVINFEDVEVVSGPFMQEILGELKTLFGDRPECIGMNEDVAATFDFVNERT